MNHSEATRTAPQIAVICGGVGAARFLRGLIRVVPAQDVTAIVNVADDMVLHGLHISPDLDTVMYTVADEIDPHRGWGLRDESWRAMEMLGRFGDRDWFSLGDRDLGTHLQRTGRLAEGASLTEVTAELASGWGIDIRLLPVSDDPIRTKVTLASDERSGPAEDTEIDFQRWFVGQKHATAVSGVRFEGIDHAQPTHQVLAAIDAADIIVIAPSNPIVSTGPVLDVPGIRAAIAASSAAVVAISPIIGGAALKGPAAAMMAELDLAASAVGIAELYADLIDVLLIDDEDAGLADDVARAGVVPWVTDTIMADPRRSARLARSTVAASTTIATRSR